MTEILPSQAVDPTRFRQALALHAAGVVIITGAADGRPTGLTATSFSSVSLDPPLVSFYVDRSSTTWRTLRHAERFGVNILTGDQADLAARFATKDVDRFAEPTSWHLDEHGTPLLDDVCAHVLCLPYTTLEIGDHVLVVGLVTDTRLVAPGRPLLYHRGRFGRFLPHSG